MKKQIKTWAVLLFIIAGLEACNNSDTHGDLLTIDVTANYPEKEIILQDFMYVEYIPLETNDDFVTQGTVMAIGNKYILVKNWIKDGNIFIFDRETGKALRKINRKGEGAEEYRMIGEIILDEDKDEIFVSCPVAKTVFVYDLFGNFKRSFKHAEDTEYSDMFNYDANNLIRYDMSEYINEGKSRGSKSYHAIISKQDGSVTRNIFIPFDKINAPIVQEGDGTSVSFVQSIIPYHENWLLVETSSDTIYKFSPKDDKLSPFVVKKHTEDPVIFLSFGTITDRFYFMKTMKKVFDFSTGRGFPISSLMYDRKEDAIFKPAVLNADYVKRKQ